MGKLPFRAVGERFELKGLIYEVEESGIGCEGCSFLYKDECVCTMTWDDRKLTSHCTAWYRKDHKNVIFKQVGEVNP